jgi:hypothetical protein
VINVNVSRGSSVGVATGYGLDGPGIESWWAGGDFPHPSRMAFGPPAYYIIGTGTFLEVKRPGRGVNHPATSSAEVKEGVGLYFYSLLWAFVACYRVTFTFTFCINNNTLSS